MHQTKIRRRGFIGAAIAVAAAPLAMLEKLGDKTVDVAVELPYTAPLDHVKIWTGAAGDYDWSNAINWSSHIVPTDGDSVVISVPAVLEGELMGTITIPNDTKLDELRVEGGSVQCGAKISVNRLILGPGNIHCGETKDPNLICVSGGGVNQPLGVITPARPARRAVWFEETEDMRPRTWGRGITHADKTP